MNVATQTRLLVVLQVTSIVTAATLPRPAAVPNLYYHAQPQVGIDVGPQPQVMQNGKPQTYVNSADISRGGKKSRAKADVKLSPVLILSNSLNLVSYSYQEYLKDPSQVIPTIQTATKDRVAAVLTSVGQTSSTCLPLVLADISVTCSNILFIETDYWFFYFILTPLNYTQPNSC